MTNQPEIPVLIAAQWVKKYLGAIIFYGLVGGLSVWAISASSGSNAPATNNQDAQQSYWYCWDSGDPAPHHLGYPVSGDHYCTNQELHDAGFAGY